MSFTVIEYQTEEEWQNLRRDLIGASDVSAILGLSPYATPFTVWADKVHGQDREVTFAMDLGKRLEDIILDAFQTETGLYVTARQLLARSTRYEWASATVDGLAYESPSNDPEAALGVVEAKSDGSFSRWNEIPDHHQIQVQWQMMVTGLDNGWLAVLHGGRQFEKYELEADPRVQQMMIDRVEAFRNKHILTGEPPEPDDHYATTRAISDVWSDPDEEQIELSHDMVADVDAALGLRERRREIDSQIKKLENRIKVGLQDADSGSFDGQERVTWRKQSRSGYTVEPAEYRVLRLKKEKKR